MSDELAVLDAPVDTSAAVETDFPVLDAPEVESETPAVENDAAAKVETKTEDGKPAVDPAEASAPITPAKIVESLQKLKAEDPAMAKVIHSHVKQGLDSQRFLKEVGAKDFAEAKTLLSKPDEATEQFRQSVEDSDAKLYAGGEAHKELVENILSDLKDNVGEQAGARFSELTTNMINKLKEADPQAHTHFIRSTFLDTSESSGLIASLNTLSAHLGAGRTAEAKALLSDISKFYQAEISAEQAGARERTDQQAAQTKETTARVETLKKDCATKVNSLCNQRLGNHLAPYLGKELKGLDRTAQEQVAAELYKALQAKLGTNNDHVAKFSKLYAQAKTQKHFDSMIKEFETRLTPDYVKQTVAETLKRLYPAKFQTVAPKPAALKAPATTKVSVNGVLQDAVLLSKRPDGLIRDYVNFKSREYHASDLSTMQMMSRGFIKSKTGSPTLVVWKKA